MRRFAVAGVVGLGTMGAGIAEVLARNGLRVVAVERDEAAQARGRQQIEESTQRAVEGGKLTPVERSELLARIGYGCALGALTEADLVIEAIPEQLDAKRALFAELDVICKPGAVFATNTSSLSVTEIAVATGRPGKVVGLHFFNPAPVMKLVEVIRTVVTEAEVVGDVEAFVQSLGKKDVTVGDRAGFIANALLFGYLNHAASMYETRYASREDLDAAMRLGCGLPMGPLALLDLIGVDTAYEILDTMYKQGRDRLHAPTPILKQMVTAGLLGRKSGRGFYSYDRPGSPTLVADAMTPSGPEAGSGAAEVRTIGIVGSGTMATGIAEVFARAGYDVWLVARAPAKVAAATAAIERSLDRGTRRGKITEADRAAALGRIRGSAALEDLAGCDAVVEAVVEDLGVKRALFAQLAVICRPDAVLATTTSSLPVIDCAAAAGVDRAGDVVGLHFFNPAPVMRLVEVVSSVSTTARTEAIAVDLVRGVGKHPVRCADRSGFIVNALLFPYLNDAVRMLEAHYAGAEDIDAAMKVGCGYPMGPFELLDAVGLDVSLAIQRELYLEFREPGFAPAPLLEHLVTAGRLGRKTGTGFGDYR